MSETKKQVSNLETMASRYVVLALAYNKLKDPHLTRDEREVYEKQIHEMLDIGSDEFVTIRDIVAGHVEQVGV
jgi:hypothetical protein